MRPLKIAIFSGSIPSTTFIEHLIEGIAETHSVVLFGVRHSQKKYASKNIKIHATPKAKLSNFWVTIFRTFALILKSPKDWYALYVEIKQYHSFYDTWNWYTKLLPIVLYKPDIIHLQWAKSVSPYMFFKKAYGIKMILSLRGAHINYSPIANVSLADSYKTEFPNIDAFHAVSKAIGLEAQQYGAASHRIQVIHSPIPKHFFDEFQTLKKHNNKTFQIVSVGRFHWIKGYTYMLDALHFLKQHGIDVSYTIIGPKFFSEDLLFQIHQLGLQDQVHLIPKLSQDQLIQKFKAFDVLVLPSLKEGIANVVLEAMALGIPVISSDCGGMAEVVIPNQTGWLVPVRDSKALAHAIQEIVDMPERDLQERAKNAHVFVKKHFLAADSIKQFMTMYESVYHS